jgi:predicted Rossmann fold nucleotide-binding protein DprA/Smf involved in DNA uptake
MTDDVQKLMELRAHHARELARIDDALLLLKQIGALTKRAEKMTSTASKTSAAAKTKKGRDPRAEHAAAKAGRRPIDTLRQLFAAAGTAPVTSEFIAEQTGLPTVKTSIPLSWLKRTGEIRKTRDGWIVKRLNLPTNGSGAHV